MIHLDPAELGVVKAILVRLVPGRNVMVFGSRAGGPVKPYSDLDLAIMGETPLTLSELAQLEEAFDCSILSFKVDVVDWASLSEAFRAEIHPNLTPLALTD